MNHDLATCDDIPCDNCDIFLQYVDRCKKENKPFGAFIIITGGGGGSGGIKNDI